MIFYNQFISEELQQFHLCWTRKIAKEVLQVAASTRGNIRKFSIYLLHLHHHVYTCTEKKQASFVFKRMQHQLLLTQNLIKEHF